YPTPMRPWRSDPDSAAIVVSISSAAARRNRAASRSIFALRPLVAATCREVVTSSWSFTWRRGSGRRNVSGPRTGGEGYEHLDCDGVAGDRVRPGDALRLAPRRKRGRRVPGDGRADARTRVRAPRAAYSRRASRGRDRRDPGLVGGLRLCGRRA